MNTAAQFDDRLLAAMAGLEKTASDPSVAGPDSLEGVETVPPDQHSGPPVQPPRPPVSINLFQHPSAHPLILDLALLKKYGPDWMLWDIETLVWRVPQDFRTKSISELNLGKIQAVKTLHYNDDYWLKWEVFNWCTQPFNNLYADFRALQVPSAAQLAVSVDIANRIRTDTAFNLEVKAFMETACRFEGVFYPPDSLAFLQVKPDHDLVDIARIADEWPKVLASGQLPTADTIVAEQLRRSLVVHRFLQESQARLSNQLSMVTNA